MTRPAVLVAIDVGGRLRRSRGRSARAFSVSSRVTEQEFRALEKAAAELDSEDFVVAGSGVHAELLAVLAKI